MVFKTVLNVCEELEDVQPVHACVQQGVHALEGSLAKIQAVINLVFERAHFHLLNKLKLFFSGGQFFES
jgi:hypothetical protein